MSFDMNPCYGKSYTLWIMGSTQVYTKQKKTNKKRRDTNDQKQKWVKEQRLRDRVKKKAREEKHNQNNLYSEREYTTMKKTNTEVYTPYDPVKTYNQDRMGWCGYRATEIVSDADVQLMGKKEYNSFSEQQIIRNSEEMKAYNMDYYKDHTEELWHWEQMYQSQRRSMADINITPKRNLKRKRDEYEKPDRGLGVSIHTIDMVYCYEHGWKEICSCMVPKPVVETDEWDEWDECKTPPEYIPGW